MGELNLELCKIQQDGGTTDITLGQSPFYKGYKGSHTAAD